MTQVTLHTLYCSCHVAISEFTLHDFLFLSLAALSAPSLVWSRRMEAPQQVSILYSMQRFSYNDLQDLYSLVTASLLRLTEQGKV